VSRDFNAAAQAPPELDWPIEITLFAKKGGPLTKKISLGKDGKLVSDASKCLMNSGTARRASLDNIAALGTLIHALDPHEAITLGELRLALPDSVSVTTKHKLVMKQGAAEPDLIARTGEYILFRPKRPAFALFDFDTKGMLPDMVDRLDELGGYWAALRTVVPELERAGRVVRPSTSAGLFRTDTGEKLLGSNGLHVYVPVRDGTDIERFLKTLHDRCWLAGLGWMMVGGGGQLLERSIVDRMVGAPERLVFEGTPVLKPPLAQDAAIRRPIVTEGEILDSEIACPPLTIIEHVKLADLRAREAHRLAPQRAKARTDFILRQSQPLAARTGLSLARATRLIERQCDDGILLPDIVLLFDDPALAGTTVSAVIADSGRFEGATLADPLEGIEYGACKAKIMRRSDGTPWIHSFAHGRTIYELKLDARAAEAALQKTPRDEVVEAFVRIALAAVLDDDELESLRNLVADRSGVGKRVLDRKLQHAREQRAERRAQEERDRRAAERSDPRPQIPAPPADAPWLPQMQVLNDVLGKSRGPESPMRDVEGFVVQVRVRRVPKMHLLTARGSNQCDTDETRLPAPEQPLLTRLDEITLAELIEQHIEYVGAETGRAVHLASPFVKHFLKRNDDALPIATGVATLPIVLPDGVLLSGRGLDRGRGIVFRVPAELEAILPKPAECTPEVVAEVMRYLTNEWLCDLACDYAGKCIIIACALTILERLLLTERPAFFVTAGQRGGGKTTTVNMVSLAVLGFRAAAAAWSPSEEERRKALFSYLREGVPLLVWDNLPRGATISCPSIEKALTAETYSDRILGESETGTAPAFTVPIFTGNNITPRGDLSSRSLGARLAVDRPDPENRPFAHPDPIAWTEANRGRILQALYTVLLGNPRLHDRNPEQAPTRFKMWWHLVGSAVEHAAAQHVRIDEEKVRWFVADPHPICPPAPISFTDLFVSGEGGDEQASSLATVLHVLRTKWRAGCKAAEVAGYAVLTDEAATEFRDAIEQASGKAMKMITATAVTWRLKAVADAPVVVGNDTLVLRYNPGNQGGTFLVRSIR
jgi:hypothetical protein